MLLSCVTLPFSIALGIIAYSQFFLGMAFGADTFFLAIATEISAEPNPPRPAPVLQHVDPVDVSARHSLHAMFETRTRLAAWIRERQDEVAPASAWLSTRQSRPTAVAD